MTALLGAAGGLIALLAVSDDRRYRAEQLLYAVALSVRGYVRAFRLLIGASR